MRSEFEKNVIHKQIIDRVRFSEKANQYLPIDALSGVDRGCADVVNVGWISYQYQQSKVDGLQKRVEALKGLAQTLWEKSNEKHKQGKVWESKTLGECADEILDELEQALKGEQYEEQRKKAEAAMSNGASLTSHRIEL